jgi:hypothetical protein
MPNRADYTNALMQAVAQRELAKQTNPLANEMAIKPRASQLLTRPGPLPPVTDISGYELPPEIKPFVFDPLGPATDQDMLRGLGQPLDSEALPVEALTPKQEPAGISQRVKDALRNLFDSTRAGEPQTEQEQLVESVLLLTGDTNPTPYVEMPIEALRELRRQLVAARAARTE